MADMHELFETHPTPMCNLHLTDAKATEKIWLQQNAGDVMINKLLQQIYQVYKRGVRLKTFG